MKTGKDFSWWVEYSFTCEFWEDVDNDWIPYRDADVGRFRCRKMDVRKEVRNFIKKSVFPQGDIRKLRVRITDCRATPEDLCKTCDHYWLDFPLPLDRYVPHCEVADRMPGKGKMDEAVPYPCTKCPFDSYEMKEDSV